MAGFLGQDWSGANFKGKLGGLLADPAQLASNPMFTGGMGLLSASRDASIDPFQAALGGLVAGKRGQQADEDRKRLADLRQQLADLIKQQGQARAGDPTTGVERQQQMSMIPGLPGSGVAPGGIVGGQATPMPPQSPFQLPGVPGPIPGQTPGIVPGAGSPVPSGPPDLALMNQAMELLQMQGNKTPSDADIASVIEFLKVQ